MSNTFFRVIQGSNNMLNFLRNFRFYSILFVALSVSCIRDDIEKLQKESWDPELAIPLVNSRFGIDRIITKFDTDGYLTSDDDDVVIIVYEGNLFEIKANEAIELSDITIPLAELQNFGIGNFQSFDYLLKTVELQSGVLDIHIEDDNQTDLLVTLTMDKTIKDGQPFEAIFEVPYEGGTNTVYDATFDISDYRFDLSGKNGNGSNDLSIRYSAKKVSGGDSVLIRKFDCTFKDLEFEFMDGYLGELDLGRHNDSIRMNMNDNFKSGTILLEDPRFDFRIKNSFGIPMLAEFGNFTGSGYGGDNALTGSGVDDGINANAPQNANDDSVITNSQLNSDNSNITQFLAISPNTLNYEFNVKANVNQDTNTYNFVRSTSELVGDAELEIPMKGRFDSVIIEDFYEFASDDADNADLAEFKLITENKFPVGIYIQIYFLDRNRNVLDSLLLDDIDVFRESATDENGFSLTPRRKETFITIGELRFGNIKRRVKELKVKGIINSDDSKQRNIRIRTSDYFDFKLGMKTKLTFK